MAKNTELSSYVFCTYMDILGDRLKHLELESNPNREQLIAKWKRDRVEMLKHNIEGEHFKGVNWSFSDSFVFVAHVPFSQRKSSWNEMFEACIVHSAVISLHMMLNGTFIRGGIGQGVAFVDKQHLVGKPLVDAYLTECQVAQHPIIALSKRTEMFFKYRKRASMFGSFCDYHLVQANASGSATSIIVVNPFTEVVFDEYMSNYDLKDRSRLKIRMSAKISSRLHRYEFEPKIYPKYALLRDLWNYSQAKLQIPVSTSDTATEFNSVRHLMA